MRKQSLIHLHALCLQVRLELEATEAIQPSTFTAYDSYGVGPAEIHRKKDKHHKALAHLLDGIEVAIQQHLVDADQITTSTS